MVVYGDRRVLRAMISVRCSRHIGRMLRTRRWLFRSRGTSVYNTSARAASEENNIALADIRELK